MTRRRQGHLEWLTGSRHRHPEPAARLERLVLVVAVVAFALAPPVRGPGTVLGLVALWAVLLLAAVRLGQPLVVHATLVAGTASVAYAALPRLWPRLLSLAIGLAAGLLATRWVPALGAAAGWLRRGSFGPDVRWLVLATVPGVAVVLVGWVAVVGEAGLAEGTRLAMQTVHGVPLWILVPVGLAFSGLNAAAEEAFFRGVFMEALLATVGTAPALLLQAAAYGMLHAAGFPSGWLGVALASAYGLLLGSIRLRAEGLLAPWLAHVAADLTIVALVAWLAAVSPAV
jgi:membrane protease YdiL (CAAX protease family)